MSDHVDFSSDPPRVYFSDNWEKEFWSNGDRKECQPRVVHIHHIVPVQDGGGDDIENLMPLCAGCHKEWHINEFSMSLDDFLSTIPLCILVRAKECGLDLEGMPYEEAIRHISPMPADEVRYVISLREKFLQEAAQYAIESSNNHLQQERQRI